MDTGCLDTFTNIPRNRIITNRIRTILVGYCTFSVASTRPILSNSRPTPDPSNPTAPNPCLLSHIPLERPSDPATKSRLLSSVCRQGRDARTCKNILLDNSSKRTIRRSRNALASILPVGSSTAASATSSSSGLRASSCLAGATTRAERPTLRSNACNNCRSLDGGSFSEDRCSR